MTKRDFYEILGLKKGATEAEIKRAYRKLAQQFHPDRNPDDKASEDRFKELSEAYEVLSDKEKRQQYDRFGHSPFGPGGPGGPGGMGGGPFGGFGGGGFGGGAGMDFGDIFGDLFGGGPRAAGPRKGTDLEYQMDIGFAEAILGAEKEISFRRSAPCETCKGMGHTPGADGGGPCPGCGGRGSIEARMGPIATQQPCPRCRGTGRAPGPACSRCGGSGAQPASERLRVKIPPGVDTGSKVRISGHGEAGKQGGRPGDLFIKVRVRPDERFRREGDDLVTPVRVGLADALLGGQTRVETLGEPVKMKIPPGTQNGQKFRFKGKGVAGKGDLYAEVQVVIPKELDEDTRKTLETLRDVLS